MPAGDKLLNAIGANGEHPRRFRDSAGFWHKRRYYYPPHALEDPHPSKHPPFDVRGESTPRRTAASVSASLYAVEDARRAGGSKAAIRALAQKEGFKGSRSSYAPVLNTRLMILLSSICATSAPNCCCTTRCIFCCSTSCRACAGSFPVRTRSWMTTSHASSRRLFVCALGAR